VEGKRALVELAGSGRQFEVVAERGRIPGPAVLFKPGPRTESDELITPEVNRGTTRLGVSVARIELQELGRAIAKIFLGL
jgi:hypothetical protein